MQPIIPASCVTERRWMLSLQSSRWTVSEDWSFSNSNQWPWISVPPEWVSKPKDVIKITEGSTVTIECVARGEPEPSVTIARKHGRSSHLLISPASFAFVSHLPIPLAGYEWKTLSSMGEKYSMKVSKSDAGSYQCRAQNGIETHIESGFELQVSGIETSLRFCLCVLLLICPPVDQYLVLSQNEALLDSSVTQSKANTLSVSCQNEEVSCQSCTLLLPPRVSWFMWVPKMFSANLLNCLSSATSNYAVRADHFDHNEPKSHHQLQHRARNTAL